MGDSGPLPLKNGHFLPKNGLKMPILGQKQCFWCSGGHFKATATVVCRCLSQHSLCCRVRKPEEGCFMAPCRKNANFCLKNDLKMPIFGRKNMVFWARVVSASPHPTYFAGA